MSSVADKIKAVVNRGNLNWSGSNTTYSVSAGYYTGGTLDSRTSYNNGYSAGRTQGQNDVKNSPNSYSLYTKSQYDTNYNNGYNAGYAKAKANITVISGSAATSGSVAYERTDGRTGNTSYLNINPGGTPIAAVSFDEGRADTWCIRIANNTLFSIGSTWSRRIKTSFSWTTSSVVLPIGTTTSHTMRYYIVVAK